LHPVGILSSRFAHDERSQEHKATFLCLNAPFTSKVQEKSDNCRNIKFISKTVSYNLHCCCRNKFISESIVVQYSIYLQSSQLTSNKTLTKCIVVPNPTMVTRMRHDITLYLHCLSCSCCYPRIFFIEYDALKIHRI